MTNGNERRRGFIRRCWGWFWRPVLITGFVLGIAFWGGFNWSMEMTNTEEFCISCHEMEANAFQEYRNTVHYSNRTGVRATCPDCHVPKTWIHKVRRKILATNELYHNFLGTIDTAEKFNAKRLELATSVWRAMKTTNSRECRNCHEFGAMDLSAQENRASKLHSDALNAGGTCIDCHRGVAHKLPEGAEAAVEQLYKDIANGH